MLAIFTGEVEDYKYYFRGKRKDLRGRSAGENVSVLGLQKDNEVGRKFIVILDSNWQIRFHQPTSGKCHEGIIPKC